MVNQRGLSHLLYLASWVFALIVGLLVIIVPLWHAAVKAEVRRLHDLIYEALAVNYPNYKLGFNASLAVLESAARNSLSKLRLTFSKPQEVLMFFRTYNQYVNDEVDTIGEPRYVTTDSNEPISISMVSDLEDEGLTERSPTNELKAKMTEQLTNLLPNITGFPVIVGIRYSSRWFESFFEKFGLNNQISVQSYFPKIGSNPVQKFEKARFTKFLNYVLPAEVSIACASNNPIQVRHLFAIPNNRCLWGPYLYLSNLLYEQILLYLTYLFGHNMEFWQIIATPQNLSLLPITYDSAFYKMTRDEISRFSRAAVWIEHTGDQPVTHILVGQDAPQIDEEQIKSQTQIPVNPNLVNLRECFQNVFTEEGQRFLVYLHSEAFQEITGAVPYEIPVFNPDTDQLDIPLAAFAFLGSIYQFMPNNQQSNLACELQLRDNITDSSNLFYYDPFELTVLQNVNAPESSYNIINFDAVHNILAHPYKSAVSPFHASQNIRLSIEPAVGFSKVNFCNLIDPGQKAHGRQDLVLNFPFVQPNDQYPIPIPICGFQMQTNILPNSLFESFNSDALRSSIEQCDRDQTRCEAFEHNKNEISKALAKLSFEAFRMVVRLVK